MTSTSRRHRLAWSLPLGMGLCLALQSGCEPIPDLRVVARHIPDDTVELLVGAMLDGDQPSQTFRVLPVRGLDHAGRERYVVGLSIGTAEAAGGVVSLGTVRDDGCLSSVVSSDRLSRSDSFSASTVELEMDPTMNAAVHTLASHLNTPRLCPKVPGLPPNRLDDAYELPIRPVIIRTNRLVAVSDAKFDGALSAYGWGLGRGSLSVGIEQDPDNCRKKISDSILAPDPMSLALQLLAASVYAPQAMQYPNYSLISYTQVELRWSKFSELLLPLGLGKDLINQIISCFAITTQGYRKVNPDGAMAEFHEASMK